MLILHILYGATFYSIALHVFIYRRLLIWLNLSLFFFILISHSLPTCLILFNGGYIIMKPVCKPKFSRSLQALNDIRSEVQGLRHKPVMWLILVWFLAPQGSQSIIILMCPFKPLNTSGVPRLIRSTTGPNKHYNPQP